MLAPYRAWLAAPLLLNLLACWTPEQPLAEKAETAPAEPAKPQVPILTVPKSWSVTITSGGGFFGHGRGRAMVSSDGTVGASRMLSGWCGSMNLAEDRAAVERAVAEAQPQLWARSYDPICCDHFSYSLEFRRDEGELGEVVYETRWQGVTTNFPADLNTLSTSVWQLQERALVSCPDR
jgi:hypothetical protein